MSREVKSEEGVLGGEPFLQGTRIRVSDVAVKYEELGYTVDEILEAYPRLSEEDVENALNYFYSNKPGFTEGSAVKAV